MVKVEGDKMKNGSIMFNLAIWKKIIEIGQTNFKIEDLTKADEDGYIGLWDDHSCYIENIVLRNHKKKQISRQICKDVENKFNNRTIK